jgi:hypothetical protein
LIVVYFPDDLGSFQPLPEGFPSVGYDQLDEIILQTMQTAERPSRANFCDPIPEIGSIRPFPIRRTRKITILALHYVHFHCSLDTAPQSSQLISRFSPPSDRITSHPLVGVAFF